MKRERLVRIGGASGYWGDSPDAPRQLIQRGQVDYIILDYLAEVTMSILVRAKAKSESDGYAKDFVELVIAPLLHEIHARKIRVVTNAGGVNVQSCQRALQELAAREGIPLKVAAVVGDDLLTQVPDLRKQGIKTLAGESLPPKLLSANAYLGAMPIVAALDAGADIVVTGRCADSALALGPLIHEFSWSKEDYDRLAMGTLAGHLLECGAQATGGNFTDWRKVCDGWADMGYPIAECREDGSFVLTKPDGTGGLVSRLSVGEQMLYEIGDPGAYIVPDVVCDFRRVTIDEIGDNRVLVKGAKGLPPTATYKVTATFSDGYRSTANTILTGPDAVAKGRAYASAILAKTRRIFRENNLPDYRRTATHFIGAQALWGDNATPDAAAAREIILRLDVHHDSRSALEIFSKEVTGAALAMAPGRCPFGAAGRPKSMPVVAQCAFLVPKADMPVTVIIGDEKFTIEGDAEFPAATHETPSTSAESPSAEVPATREVPLILLAVARSGDKGNDANIGVIARKPEYLPFIRAALTTGAVARRFSHVLKGNVERYDVEGLHGLNFLLRQTLDGGGTSSLHLDSQAKTYAQQILEMPIGVSAAIADDVALHQPEGIA